MEYTYFDLLPNEIIAMIWEKKEKAEHVDKMMLVWRELRDKQKDFLSHIYYYVDREHIGSCFHDSYDFTHVSDEFCEGEDPDYDSECEPSSKCFTCGAIKPGMEISCWNCIYKLEHIASLRICTEGKTPKDLFLEYPGNLLETFLNNDQEWSE